MKARWKMIIGAAVLAIPLGFWIEADFKEWDLNNHIPFVSIEESKMMHVFAGRLDPSVNEFTLSDGRYQIVEVWLQFYAAAERRSLFYTHQKNYAELILCVQIVERGASRPSSFPSDIRIKNANSEHINSTATNNVFFSEVGTQIPETVTLRSVKNGSELVVKLKQSALN